MVLAENIGHHLKIYGPREKLNGLFLKIYGHSPGDRRSFQIIISHKNDSKYTVHPGSVKTVHFELWDLMFYHLISFESYKMILQH